MARFLLLHGFAGVGPDHWLVWLSQELRARGHLARLRKLPSPNAPALDAWMTAMTERLAALGTDGAGDAEHLFERGDRGGELVVVAHSLGGRLWLHHAQAGETALPIADRAVLVAPPRLPPSDRTDDFYSLDIPAIDPQRVSRATRIVVSENDHYWPDAGAVAGVAQPLGLPHDFIEGAGHFEPRDGFGPWPGLLAWCLGETETIGR